MALFHLRIQIEMLTILSTRLAECPKSTKHERFISNAVGFSSLLEADNYFGYLLIIQGLMNKSFKLTY